MQVAGLAVVSVLCFTSSSFVALLTDVPVYISLLVIHFIFVLKNYQPNIIAFSNFIMSLWLQMLYYWRRQRVNVIYTSLFLILYYFIGTWSYFACQVLKLAENVEGPFLYTFYFLLFTLSSNTPFSSHLFLAGFPSFLLSAIHWLIRWFCFMLLLEILPFVYA